MTTATYMFFNTYITFIHMHVTHYSTGSESEEEKIHFFLQPYFPYGRLILLVVSIKVIKSFKRIICTTAIVTTDSGFFLTMWYNLPKAFSNLPQ